MMGIEIPRGMAEDISEMLGVLAGAMEDDRAGLCVVKTTKAQLDCLVAEAEGEEKMPFTWTCEWCGAKLPSTVAHCPCWGFKAEEKPDESD